MKTLKVLHLASFDGNIGDNANHNGFYKNFLQNLNFTFQIEYLEIREFYWKKRFFDESFVKQVNNFDLLIIGGGNYFELWVENSKTGTSFDIDLELFKKIKIPVLFNALGVDPGQGASDNSLTKFRNFLDILTNSEQYLVSIRNDGSKEAIETHVGRKYLNNIVWTPDGGFDMNINKEASFIKTKKYIAINLANDMIESRFPNKTKDDISYEQFILDMRDYFSNILNKYKDIELVFIPHIFRDIEVINDILAVMPDKYRRKRLYIAPLVHGQGAEEEIFSIYKNAYISISMRFHSNVCSIANETPTIALYNYRQIKKLFEELNLNEFVIQVNKVDFSQKLLKLTENYINDYKTHKDLFRSESLEQKKLYRGYHQTIAKWILSKYEK